MEKLPNTLFKTYENREHATAFIKEGVIRLGSLEDYKRIEDETRRDPLEGEGRQKVRGVAGSLVERSVVTIHPLYAFCMCSPDADRATRQEFGPFTVRIVDPEAFVRDVEESVRSLAEREGRSPTIDVCGVDYDKDEEGDCSEEFWSRKEYRLIYAQKPRRFEMDREVRIVAMLSGGPNGAPGSLTVKLKRFTEYLQREGRW
jgi:hypothetical protein